MKITQVDVFRRPLRYVGGTYRWGPGVPLTVADAVVIRITTDEGLYGVGECCPIPHYLPAHADGIVGLAPALARSILGLDPRQLALVERTMDRAVLGHGYAKAPFDMACWDILGKATGQPVWMLLGGRLTDGAPMYRVAPQKSMEETVAEMERHRADGYRQFQIKVGGDWAADIERIRTTVPLLQTGETAFADANTGWSVTEAVRVARATEDLDYYLEQPCLTYDECLQVRRRTTLPMKLDECIPDLAAAERAVRDQAAEVICLKIHRHGGLSKTRRIRDYLAEHRIPMVVEDAWGGEIVTAAISHLAASTPPELVAATTDLHNYVVESTGIGGATVVGGKLFAPDSPGLGVEPDMESLGDPVHTINHTIKAP